jgi:hypothetical protein
MDQQPGMEVQREGLAGRKKLRVAGRFGCNPTPRIDTLRFNATRKKIASHR